MNTTTNLFACCLCVATSALAQGPLLLPASTNLAQELPNYELQPFASNDARVQMFYDATEVGASTFTATELSLRYDGPIPPVGSPGPFQIQQMEVLIGVSTVAMPGARFADNLTQPLTTVFSGSKTYYPDNGSSGPQAWGATNDSLRYVFSSPVTVTIPTGGWLVVELRMRNNNFLGYAHTFLDGVATTGGPIDGSAATFGQGCAIAASAPAITIGTSGKRAPGAAHFVTGQNLGAGSATLVMFGLDTTQSPFGPLPFRLPGTQCDLLVSPDALVFAMANGNGELNNASLGNAFAVPADPVFGGLVVHQQLAVLAPGANSFGAAFSNAQSVTFGTLDPLGRGTVIATNEFAADAPVATQVRPFGYALRLGTL
jgi:hypothetical protein